MNRHERAYLEGFCDLCKVRTVVTDRTLVEEILGALDEERDADPAITPWRRGPNAALRAVLRSQ